jgi:anti-anti-sigma factor
VLVLRGDHDLSTTPHLVEQLDEALSAGAGLVVDVSDGRFMDSAVVNALLTARERALARREGSFAVVAPPGSVPSCVLALVVGTLIPTYPNRADAVAAVA